MVYSCEMCSGYRVPFVALDLATIFNHYGRYHRHDPNFSVRCVVEGCGASYTRLEGYRSHIRRNHRHLLSGDGIDFDNLDNETPSIFGENDMPVLDLELGNEFIPLEESDMLAPRDQSAPESGNDATDVNFSKKQNGLFLLKTRELHSLSQKATDSLVSDTTFIVKNTVEQLKVKVKSSLDNAGVKFEDIPELKELFEPCSTACNPFDGLVGKTQQIRYFSEHFGLVEPEKHVLGYQHRPSRSGSRQRIRPKPDEMVVVPLLRSLEAMLNNSSILYEIQHPHTNHIANGCMYDFCDSETFKSHPLFSKDPNALQIILYFDEVECVNPLGSKTKKHKLGVFYFTLGNICPKYRSQLKSIQLVAIVKRSLINKYGVNAILEPIMSEIAQLEHDGGHQFIVHGKVQSFSGTIAFVCGDNLGQQELGGFKVGPSANCRCRECMGKVNDIKTLFHEVHFILRTCDAHDDQCDEIVEDPTLSSAYGINFSSVLCQSRYYHVVGGLPADAMHDVLEGCLQYECKELLKYLIQQQKYFNLSYLNSSLRNFDFGYQNDSNKPSAISDATINSDSNTLHQNASQMWCLARFLPLLVGSKVPETDAKWQLYLTMLDITDTIFSPVTNANQCANLALLIEEHHKEFQLLYPNCSIIPKMHYMIHYPHSMTRLGPVMTNWCMRFEAKHRYMKQMAGHLGNFTNLPWTMAERHQLRQCYLLSDLEKPVQNGKGKHCVAGTASYFELLRVKDPLASEHSDIAESLWVTVSGTLYKVGSVLLTGFDHFLPSFSTVKKIIIIDSDVHKLFFVVECLNTVEYNEHYHSYRVEKPVEEVIAICTQDDLPLHLPMHYTSPVGASGFYVNVKYDVDLLNVFNL